VGKENPEIPRTIRIVGSIIAFFFAAYRHYKTGELITD
jgi:hypothetical protein